MQQLEKSRSQRRDPPIALLANVRILLAKTLRLLDTSAFSCARSLLVSAQELAGHISNRPSRRLILADASYNEGYLSYLAGHHTDAAYHMDESARLASEAGDLVRANISAAVAVVARTRSGATTGLDTLNRCREVFFDNQDNDEARDWTSHIFIDETDVRLRFAAGRSSAQLLDPVFAALDRAKIAMEENDNPSEFASLYRMLGRARLASRDWRQAADFLALAQRYEIQFAIMEGRAATARDRGLALEKLGELDEASEVYRAALSLPPQLDNSDAQTEIRRRARRRGLPLNILFSPNQRGTRS
mgnify:FL=1